MRVKTAAIWLYPALGVLLMAGRPPAAQARPAVRDTDQWMIVRGASYELRASKTTGAFDFLVDPGGKGEWVSAMRPGGELGWYGYDLNGGGGASTRNARPTVTVTRHARGVTVSARCVLDAALGLAHVAQYDCRDDFVIVCSRYEGPAPPQGMALVRTGPKLDVDIVRLDHYLFHDETGAPRTGALTGRTRDFYTGVRAWGQADAANEYDAKRPYQMLYSPQTRAKLAVIYPFANDVWRGQSRFLQLYRDGGNYWYTGAGGTSALGRDYFVCLYTDDAPDEWRLDARMPTLLAEAREAVQSGEVKATIRHRPGPGDAPMYLVSYDHAVGYPKIQDEARKSAAFLNGYAELRVGLQAEGYTWDWLSQNDPAFVAEAKGWLTKYQGRWAPGGGSYGQPYFTFISEESGIRQMFYGTRAIRQRLGYDNRVYIHSEHETMPQMPQILAGMGYRGAFFRTHMGYGGDGPSRDADWVRWIGPDGSAINAVPAYTGGEHTLGNEWLLINYKPGIEWNKGPAFTWDDVENLKTEMLSRGLAMPVVSRCEDWYTRPSKPLLDDVRAHADQRTRWATAEETFDLLERSHVKPVDMHCGVNDFAPHQPWGYAGNRTWTGPRVASSQALTAEALSVAAIFSGLKWTPEHQRRLDDAWKNLLIGEHHDALICAIYNEGRDFTVPSMRLSADLSREMAGYLATHISVRGRAVLAFNPTAPPRTEAILIPDAPGIAGVLDPAGKPLPCQRDGAGLWFLAGDVPALGYKALRLVPGDTAPASPPPPGHGLTTDRYAVEFGAKGGLAQLKDLRSGRSLIGAGGVTGVLRGLVGRDQVQSEGSVAITQNGPCVWQAKESGMVGPIAYATTYTFSAGNPRVDLHIRLQIPKGTRIACRDDQGTPESRRGGGAFFDNGAKLRYSLDTGLGDAARVVRHQPLIVSEMPASAGTVDANLWASLERDDAGLAIANRGSMGLRRVGGSLEPLLAYSGEYVWGDNFLEGTYDYDLSLIPYGGTRDRAAAHRAAIEFDRPMYVLAFDGSGGRLPTTRKIVDLGASPDSVTALALFPQDGHVFVRLCNMSPAPLAVKLPAARSADLALRLGSAVTGPPKLSPWRAQTYELLGRPYD